MRLSKSQVLAGLQCEKHLHLALHHPGLAEPRESFAAATGRAVERQARLAFPGGVLIERLAGAADPFLHTAALLRDPSVTTLFEAAFRGEGLVVFVDVLRRAGGQWHLIEIKAATAAEDRHIDDVTVQVIALQGAGIAPSRVELLHVNKDFVYTGGGNYAGLFVREDVTERVRRHLPFMSAQVKRLKAVAAGPQPVRHVGSHCRRPYVCEYTSYCEQGDARYPVACLPNASVVTQTLLARGIYDIRDIPPDLLSGEIHRWIRNVTVRGEPDLLPGAARVLQGLAHPRYFLDFESIQFAIPLWAGTHPYQPLPFQWSCHVQQADGALVHREFLDTSGKDPRRGFAESLLAVCGENGPIVVYNQAFEKGVIKGLAACFTDIADRLLALNTRIFDLLPVVRRYYYHPEMKGSWSLKRVLPCLVPELGYSALGRVQDGMQAQQAYFDLIGGGLDAAAVQALDRDLRAYCRLDTYAMVAMVDKLCADAVPAPEGAGR